MNQDPSHEEQQATADVSAQRIARVYAEALLNAAEKQDQADTVQEELESLVRDGFQSAALAELFTSAAVGRKRKAELIQQVFASRASPTLLHFLQVVNEHERLELLRPILQAFRQLRDERAGRAHVLVRTAVPLPDDQRNRLVEELRRTFHVEPMLESQVDPELLGGMVVRVGDWLFDASVRTQIETLRNQLIASSSHEIQSRRDHFSSDGAN